MAPLKGPTSLADAALSSLVLSINRLIHREASIFYVHDDSTNQIMQCLRKEVKEAVRGYVCRRLPAHLQARLIGRLVWRGGDRQAPCPHLVLDLLLTARLTALTLHLTKETRLKMASMVSSVGSGDKAGLLRLAEDDISKCLATLDTVMQEADGAREPLGLERLLIVDRSTDPDFQGDPINNMTNTNLNIGGRVGDWASIMQRLTRVAARLAGGSAPRLTHLVLPFASDTIMAHVAKIKNLQLFQNVYRSTITQVTHTVVIL